MTIVAYSPLGKGMLTGSITDKSQIANDIRGTIPRFQAENFDKNQLLVNEFSKIAAKKGVNGGQLAIAWVIAQGAIPIFGTRTAARVVENFKGGDVHLSEAELKEIRQIIESARPVGDRYSAHHMSLVGK